jgi:hypothetical protein
LEEEYNANLSQIETAYQEELEKIEQQHQSRLEEIQTEYEKYLANWSENLATAARDSSLKGEEIGYTNDKESALSRYESNKFILDSNFNMEKTKINNQQAMREYQNNATKNFDSFGSNGSLTGSNNISAGFGGMFNIMRYFMIGIPALMLLAILISIIAKIIQVKNLSYVITDKRAIIQKGAVGLDYRSIEYTKIDDLYVNVGLIDKIFNTGTIVLLNEYAYSSGNRSNHTSGGYYKKVDESNSFMAIENPYKVLKIIQKVSQDIRTDVYYPNDLRPAENPGYRTRYRR